MQDLTEGDGLDNWHGYGTFYVSRIGPWAHAASLLWTRGRKVAMTWNQPLLFLQKNSTLSGLSGAASHPDRQKIRIIWLFFEHGLHWQFEVRLLLFTLCTCEKPFDHAWFDVLEAITVYCTVLYCTVLYCAVLCCTVLYCAVLYCTVLYCAVLYCTVLCCTVLYCTVLYCAVLYCTVLYCAVLYCTCDENVLEVMC